mgnify:FL=1
MGQFRVRHALPCQTNSRTRLVWSELLAQLRELIQLGITRGAKPLVERLVKDPAVFGPGELFERKNHGYLQ